MKLKKNNGQGTVQHPPRPRARRRLVFIGAIAAIVVFTAVFAVVQVRANNRVAARVDAALAEVSALASISYDSAYVNLFSGVVHVKGIEAVLTGSPDFIRADSVVLYDLEKKAQDPETDSIHFAIKNLGVEAGSSLWGATAKVLQRMDYTLMSADVECRATYNRPFSRLEVESLVMDIKDFGRVDLAFALANFKLGKNGLTLASLFRSGNALPDTGVGKARFVYEDHSFFTRLLAYRARQEQKTESQVREEQLADIRRRILMEKNPAGQERLSAFKKFVADPKRLTVLLDPVSPIPLMQLKDLQDPGQWPALLRMTVSAQ